MSELSFNTPNGAVVDRPLLIAYLNTSTTASPTWSPFGKRVEDSSMEMDWGDNSSQDILGNGFTTMRKPVITQTFDPWTLDSSEAAQKKIWNLAVREQNVPALTNQDVLIVHFYAGTADTAVFAERYESCAVRPTGLGGSETVDMPVDVTYGGKRSTGTAAATAGVVTFTPDA